MEKINEVKKEKATKETKTKVVTSVTAFRKVCNKIVAGLHYKNLLNNSAIGENPKHLQRLLFCIQRSHMG